MPALCDKCAAALGCAGEAGVCRICIGALSNPAKLALDVRTALERYTDVRCVNVSVVSSRACMLRSAVVSGSRVDVRELLQAAAARAVEEAGLAAGAADAADATLTVTVLHAEAEAQVAELWPQFAPEPQKGQPEEKRTASDGAAYTKAQFKRHYGGVKEWAAAKPDPQHPPASVLRDGIAQADRAVLEALVLPAVTEAAEVAVAARRPSLLLAGRYLKLDRSLPQSPWVIAGKRVGGTSLQEEMARPLLPHLFPSGVGDPPAKRRRGGGDADSFMASILQSIGGVNLVGAGREDMDVRMLGSGRPFVLDVPDPPRCGFGAADLRQMESDVNVSDSVQIVPGSLRVADSGIMVRMHEASESKRKEYRCVVWVARCLRDEAGRRLCDSLSGISDLAIDQKTPVRVLHRRTAKTRPRFVHSAKVDVLNDHWMVLDVVTSAGTYVKEFVNGDRGRTRPSVAEWFSCPADIMQLDVTDVFCDVV